ncbi:Carbamoyl-phosphate synthase large chain [Rickettsiales bacterium Ac37b]|nr:Carbamoyl-phosphate synthase large chain [Rickettsiales bacterium Ac37b]
MPRRTDIKSILVIGAGPITIGQACEFDYSGTQACKALKEEGYKIILVNSNPATIMTDPDIAYITYIEPITAEFVAKIIAKDRPDAILPTVGGQTALNCALELADMGILEKYNVELIGAKREAIEKSENRRLFKEAMERIGLECPKNAIVNSLKEGLEALEYIGLPAIIRPSFTLGGAGGGIAYTKEDYIELVKSGLDTSPVREILIDESVIGWKEYEMEVVRDSADNTIIVCSIENIDPMGVHTGDSITVAPALTLTDKEYQTMRNASVAVLKEIGVSTGGSNVQFAINPENGRMLVIEMNPRVSRSSALASKATGFPIAKIAAKLAVGYRLDEINNDCTKVTPASFEPVIDYIVTKIPRFTFEKFSLTKAVLSSSMKSVGEVMAIGRSFAESLQKALRSLDIGLTGLNDLNLQNSNKDIILDKLKLFTPERLLLIAEAFRQDISLEEIHEITKYDRWFLEQLKMLVYAENQLKKYGLPTTKYELLNLKKQGFSDLRIAELCKIEAHEIRRLRHKLGVRPVYKRIDTCAAEFESTTPYLYSCYESYDTELNQDTECEAQPSNRKKIMILGSGSNRIGQGIEFDYACVHAVYAFREAGFETIMVNCNPETVSTDYDTPDRLYFEPLQFEDIMEIIDKEKSNGNFIGVSLQFGGQTPLKLSYALSSAGVSIIGTSYDSIDRAEDRERFKNLLIEHGFNYPENFICYSEEEAREKASLISYPIVARPSYVLGGRAMEVLHDNQSFEEYLDENKNIFSTGPLVIDKFINNAIEVDVDAICDGKDVFIAGIMEHIEEAGIHSGDSVCALPSFSLSQDIIAKIITYTQSLGTALNVLGFINIQYAIQDNKIYILEVNTRSSRTVPFVAKTIGIPIAKIAALVSLDKKLSDFGLNSNIRVDQLLNYTSIKTPVFPFARFPDVDIILGPEMKSTGEAMGIDKDFPSAFAKSQISSGTKIPINGTVFISVKDYDKKAVVPIASEFIKLGFSIIATRGTGNFLLAKGLDVKIVNKVREGSPHIVDLISNNEVKLVVNTTENKQAIRDSFSIRRTALMNKIPCITTISGTKAIIQSIARLKNDKEGLDVLSLQDYFKVVHNKLKVNFKDIY